MKIKQVQKEQLLEETNSVDLQAEDILNILRSVNNLLSNRLPTDDVKIVKKAINDLIAEQVETYKK
jgi:hypothetical protein